MNRMGRACTGQARLSRTLSGGTDFGSIVIVARNASLGTDGDIERLVVEARPVIEAILSRYRRGTLMVPEDAEDVIATIQLRLVEKLRAVHAGDDEPIRNFQNYVATLTYNSASDFMRRQFPDRARLKNRVRYALTHDPRLAMWITGEGYAAGFAEWSGAAEALPAAPRLAAPAPGDTAEAIAAVLSAARRPVLVDAIVDSLAHGGPVPADALPDDLPGLESDAAARLEERDFVCALWGEIRQLRPHQRKALLLNLRYGGDLDVLTVLMMSGIATAAELASALEMTQEALLAIWKELPLEDARIAEMLHLTRQQVVNLRKAARDRLSRRLPR